VGPGRCGVSKIKIALVNNYHPFVHGGAEMTVDALADRLREQGHDVSISRIPFPTRLDESLIINMLSSRSLCFDEADKVIAFKFPAYLVRHPNKTLWLFHQFRQVYELWDTEYGLRDTPENRMLRDLITRCDTESVAAAKSVYTIAREVSARLQRFNGIGSSVLYTPVDRTPCRCHEYGDFLFYASRLNSLKRQHLAVESMKHTRSAVKLVLAGQAEDPAYEARLRELIEVNGLADRVALLGWIEESRKFNLLANSLAALYLAYREDSPGLATFEAFYSRKAIITLDDSGGTNELVADGETGYVVAPDPVALAARFDELYEHRERARALGERAHEDLVARDISWRSVIEHLTQ
jgi:glycosyltransferase involved in cell wall biosynthesis